MPARDAFEAAFAVGCQIGDACWEGMGARGLGLVKIATGDVDDGIAWLDDASARCIRIPDTYLWIHGYCLDALCEQAIIHGAEGAGRWVARLESMAARTGMNELLVRAFLHRAALGDDGRPRVGGDVRGPDRQPGGPAPRRGGRARVTAERAPSSHHPDAIWTSPITPST